MQKYLYYACDELARHGFEVRTVGSTNLQIPRRLDERNVLVDTPPTPRPSLRSLWSSKRALNEVIHTIKNFDPDVVHFVNKHVWNYILLQRTRRRHINVKWLHTFHDPIGHEGDSVQRGVIVYHRLVQRLLDAVVVHSETAQNQTLKVLRPPCRVERAPLGVSQWREYQDITPEAAKRALVFGRLNRYKGCELYPEIFHEVYRLDPGVKVTIAGEPSKDLPRELLRRIAACPNVHLDDHFIEEELTERYFREAALVLTPYTSITQSGVLLDAFSNSRAVLAFQIDGISEFLPSSLMTVPAFDTCEYARIMVNLMSDSAACAKAGRQAWEFGRDRFTPVSMAAGLAQTYEGITGGDTHVPSGDM